MLAKIKSREPLTVPPSIQKRAGLSEGDQVEFHAVRGRITIIAKVADGDGLSHSQRQAIDAEIDKGMDDVRAGRVHGPFTAGEATRFLRAELKRRSGRRK